VKTLKRNNSGKEKRSRERWREWEDNYLRKNYGNKSNSSISRSIGRSKSAIIARAKILNLIDYKPEHWSEEETKMLYELYPDDKYTIDQVAEKLNKPRSAVVWQAYKRKIKRPERGHEWTKKEKDYLKKHYTTKTYKEIAKHLGLTENAVSHKVYRMGLKYRERGRPWTEEEKDFIRKNYKKIPTKEIAHHLNRTVNSIITVASPLGVTNSRPRPWSEDEKKYVKKHYGNIPIEEIAKTLNRTVTAVNAAALKLNLKKKRKKREAKIESQQPESNSVTDPVSSPVKDEPESTGNDSENTFSLQTK
jgi:predicted DNA-binding protein YlxM (UPF0122 family)